MIRLFYKNNYNTAEDQLSPFICEKVFNQHIQQGNQYNSHLVSSGALLHLLPKHFRGSIWGTGNCKYIFKKFPLANVKLLRGPLTGETCQADYFGDPVILVNRFVKKPKAKFTIGIVFDINDIDKKSNLLCGKRNFSRIHPTKSALEYIEHIASCRYIISSTVYGIMIADSYHIPCIAATFNDPKRYPENYFQFADYYHTTGRKLLIADLSHKRNAQEIINQMTVVNRLNFLVLQESILRNVPAL